MLCTYKFVKNEYTYGLSLYMWIAQVIQFLYLFMFLCNLDAEFSITLGKRINFYKNVSEQCGHD